MILTNTREKNLLSLSEHLGVVFRNITLLDTALTHTSYANEVKNGTVHNERLEFLGDAVLELSSSTYLFNKFPHMPEGEMTKARASVVCETTLAAISAQMGVGKYLLLGKGERQSGGAKRPSILADAFESIIGAIYLDQGWQTADRYIIAKLHNALLAVEQGYNLKDYKTILQEVVQSRGECVSYKLTDESGPDHAKNFSFAAIVSGKEKGSGSGTSKKEAEQHAAFEALKKYGYMNK